MDIDSSGWYTNVFGNLTGRSRRKERIPDYTLDSALTIREELTVFPELCELACESPGNSTGSTPSKQEYIVQKNKGTCIGTSIINFQGLVRSLISFGDYEQIGEINRQYDTRSSSNASMHSGATVLNSHDCACLEAMCKDLFTGNLPQPPVVNTGLLNGLFNAEDSPAIRALLIWENALSCLTSFSNHLEIHPSEMFPINVANENHVRIGRDGDLICASFQCNVPISTFNLPQLASICLLHATYADSLKVQATRPIFLTAAKTIPCSPECWLPPYFSQQDAEDIVLSTRPSQQILYNSSTLAKEIPILTILRDVAILLCSGQLVSHQLHLLHKACGRSSDVLGIVLRSYKNTLVSELYLNSDLLYRHVGSKLHLLCLKDVLAQRRIVLTMAKLRSHFVDYFVPEYKTINTLYSIGDTALVVKGNDAFGFVKTFETEAIANLHKKSEEKLDFVIRSEFYDTMIEDINTVASELGISTLALKLHELFSSLLEEEILEMAGLFRHWGHPIIFVSKGLEKVHTNATKELPSNPTLMRELAADLKHLLIRDYYKRNGRWPPRTRYHGHNKILRRAIRTCTFPSVSMGDHIGAEWLEVKYDWCIDRNSVIPILELIGDKSHSITRSELRELLKGKSLLTKSSSRRVLETLLNCSVVDIDQLLREIDQVGIPEDDLLIQLNEKEREMKLEGRLFALMTFRLRCYFVATEWLISKYILPILPEISVNKSQTELQKSLYNLTGVNLNEKEFNQHFIHLDYEKWNNFQRHESTYEVFKVIDEALGYTNLVSRTHEIFSKCIITYSKRLDKIPKDLSESLPWCWGGHKGGLEGLRQKGWSVVGALLLRKVGRLVGRRIQMLLQGDNQLVVLKYDCMYSRGEPEYLQERLSIRNLSDEVLSAICTLSDSIGLHIKKEETWMSNNILYYGKYPVLYGTARGMVLKRLCRLFSMANELTPSLANLLNATVTTCLSAGIQKTCSWELPIICWWYQCRIVNQYMQYDPLCGQGGWSILRGYFHPRPTSKVWKPSIDSHQYRTLLRILLTEPSMGGIGGTLPLRFSIRSFPDPVCESLTCCKWMMEYPFVTQSIRTSVQAIGNPPLGRYTQYISLLEDPTSLNISKTTKPTNIIRDAVLNLLKLEKDSLVKNVDLYKALHVLDQDEENFVSQLMEITPCFVKLISNIYSASIFGVAQSVVAKFAGTRTLVTLALQNASINVRGKLAECENKLYRSLAVLISESHASSWECSYLQACTLRNKGWGLMLVGVTIPHPLEQFKEYHARQCAGCQENYHYTDLKSGFMLAIPDKQILDNRKLLQRGDFEPYLGGRTAEKRIGLTALEGDTRMTPVERVSRLLRDSGWVYKKGGYLHRMILQLLSSFTDLDIESLVAAYTITSGDLEHRYSTSRIPTGAFCSNSFTGPSHVNCSSNNMGVLGRGRDNYLIVYQALFLLASTRQYHRLQLHGASYASHWHPSCVTCLASCSDFTCELPCQVETITPTLSQLPIPYERATAIPSSLEYLGRYTFLSESAVKVKLPTWIRLPEVSGNEPIYTLKNSLLLILSLTTTNLPLEDSRLPFEISRTISVSHIECFPVLDLIRCQAMLITLSCVIRNLQEFNNSQSNTSVGDSILRLIANDDERLRIEAGRVAETTGTSLLIRTIGNSHKAVADLVQGYPGPRVSPYPITHRVLLNLYRGTLKHRIQNTPLATQMEIAHNLFERIIVPSDYQSASFVLGLAYLQKVLCSSETIVTLQGWRERLITRLSSTQELTDPTTIIKGEKLSRYTRIWKIDTDMKSLVKALPRDRVGVHLPRVHKLILPPSKSAIILHLRQETKEEQKQGLNFMEFRSPTVHLIRPVVFGANGTRKILSILSEVINPKPQVIVVAGDGNGGFSRACLSYYPSSRILFTSLAQYAGSLEQAGNIQIPMCLMDLDQTETVARTIAPDNVLTEETDMTAPGWVGGVLHRLGGLSPDLIVSDAELRDRSKITRLISQVLNLASAAAAPEVLIKLHLRPDSQHPLCEDLKQILNKTPRYACRFLRSPYSNFGSLEVYVHFVAMESLTGALTMETSWFTPQTQVDDSDLVRANRVAFMLSDRGQVAFARSDTLFKGDASYQVEWTQRGLWEGDQLSAELGVTLPTTIEVVIKMSLIDRLHSIFNSLVSSVVKTAAFRSGIDACRRGRVVPRSVAVSLIGASIASGVVVAVLCDSVPLYKLAARWYRRDSVAIRCNCRKDIPFDLGLRGHNIGMDIPYREFRPSCNSMVRYLSAIVRCYHRGAISKLHPESFRGLVNTPLCLVLFKKEVDFRTDYLANDEGVISKCGGR